jgi:hypothetical protein
VKRPVLGAVLATALALGAHAVLLRDSTEGGWAAGLLAGQVSVTGALVLLLLILRLALFLALPVVVTGALAAALLARLGVTRRGSPRGTAGAPP